jgi:hypothetical protein
VGGLGLGLGLGFEGILSLLCLLIGEVRDVGSGRGRPKSVLGCDPWEERFCPVIAPRKLVLTTF